MAEAGDADGGIMGQADVGREMRAGEGGLPAAGGAPARAGRDAVAETRRRLSRPYGPTATPAVRDPL